MLRPNPSGDLPQVHPTAFIDPTAIVCGKVIIGPEVFVGPYAVIRADEVDANGEMAAIHIGAGSNIQDGVVIHSLAGAPVEIGTGASIAHRAIVHGPAHIGDGVFVGFNSVVFDASIGAGAMIRHSSVVEHCELAGEKVVESGQHVDQGVDPVAIGAVSAGDRAFADEVAKTNVWLVGGYGRMGVG